MSDDTEPGIPGYPKPLVGILSSAVVAVVASIPFGFEGWIIGALVGAAIGDQLIRRMQDGEDADDGSDGRQTEGNGRRAGGNDERRAGSNDEQGAKGNDERGAGGGGG